MLRDRVHFGLVVCAVLVASLAAAMPAWPTEVVVFDEASYGGPIGGFYSGSFGGPPSSASYVTELTE